ncbi:hypothetical protein FOA52_011301 [Chlamydomonas sp. UWO 241]|nr:hypothetical protein FOA52_011301 [Chlamydomonas sp. UWO 241]
MKASTLALAGATLLLALALAPMGADAHMTKFFWEAKQSSGVIDFYLFHYHGDGIALSNHLSTFTYGGVDVLILEVVGATLPVANDVNTSGLQCVGTCTGPDVSWVYKVEGVPLESADLCSSGVSGAITTPRTWMALGFCRQVF